MFYSQVRDLKFENFVGLRKTDTQYNINFSYQTKYFNSAEMYSYMRENIAYFGELKVLSIVSKCLFALSEES